VIEVRLYKLRVVAGQALSGCYPLIGFVVVDGWEFKRGVSGSEKKETRGSGHQGAGYQDIGISGYQDIRISGYQDIR
jgi:hypothetical protein